jgi:hypothetical protein
MADKLWRVFYVLLQFADGSGTRAYIVNANTERGAVQVARRRDDVPATMVVKRVSQIDYAHAWRAL